MTLTQIQTSCAAHKHAVMPSFVFMSVIRKKLNSTGKLLHDV